jgi:hypothetical protein
MGGLACRKLATAQRFVREADASHFGAWLPFAVLFLMVAPSTVLVRVCFRAAQAVHKQSVVAGGAPL